MEINEALAAQSFSVIGLAASINNLEVPKHRIAELGIFKEKGIRTTSVKIEYKDGQVMLVPEKERGADGVRTNGTKRKLYTFEAVHLPVEGGLSADSVQNLRAFGSETELEELDVLIQEEQEVHRSSLDATIEYLRMGALTGQVIGAEGNVIVDLFNVFGIPADSNKHDIDFTKPLKTQLLDVKRKSEKNQKGIKGKRYRAFCSSGFFDELLENADFQKAHERYLNGKALREDVRAGVEWQGIIWEEYEEEVGDKRFIPQGEARVYPEDKPGLFATWFAPADYNETVGTKGLPYYSKSEPRRMGKGIDIESQSNPINVCTNPLAVRRLVKKAA